MTTNNPVVERVARYLDIYAHADDDIILDSDGGNAILRLGDLRAIAALNHPQPGVNDALRLLKYALEAIESQRSEPLFIARDAIRNFLDDQVSSLESQSR